jgi:hypothetical protein
MSVYAVLIFVHVLGAVGMFTASGIEGMTLARLYPGPDSPDSEGAARGLVRARRAAMLAMLATIATGIWMMRIAWTPQPWQQAAMAAMAALVVVGAVLRRRANRRACRRDHRARHPRPPDIAQAQSGPRRRHPRAHDHEAGRRGLLVDRRRRGDHGCVLGGGLAAGPRQAVDYRWRIGSIARLPPQSHCTS